MARETTWNEFIARLCDSLAAEHDRLERAAVRSQKGERAALVLLIADVEEEASHEVEFAVRLARAPYSVSRSVERRIRPGATNFQG